MPVLDARGEMVTGGDHVACLTKLHGIDAGDISQVDFIDTISSSLILKGRIGTFHSSSFLKINLQVPIPYPKVIPPNLELMADKIIQLINSKPWSPTKEQIINELKQC